MTWIDKRSIYAQFEKDTKAFNSVQLVFLPFPFITRMKNCFLGILFFSLNFSFFRFFLPGYFESDTWKHVHSAQDTLSQEPGNKGDQLGKLRGELAAPKASASGYSWSWGRGWGKGTPPTLLHPGGWRILPFRSSQSIMGRKKALTLIIGWPSDLRVSFVKQKDTAL